MPSGSCKLEDFEHPALAGFVLGADAELDAGFGELTLHLREFVGAGDAEAEVGEIVAAVVMHHDPMMVIVHPQVASIGLAFVGQLKAEDAGGEVLPRGEVFDADSHVAEFRDMNHVHLLLGAYGSIYRASLRTQSEPSATRRTESVSVG